METTSRLLPLNLVARRLRVPVRWLRAEAEAQRIPCLIAGNHFLCDPTAVEAREKAMPRLDSIVPDASAEKAGAAKNSPIRQALRADSIPIELREMPRWACWQEVPSTDGKKPGKPPIEATAKRINSFAGKH